jgi:hypothetical protein
MQITYWTALKTEACNNVVTTTQGTAASGLTLARIGIYAVANNGDLSLAASTPDLSATAWLSAFAGYRAALSAPFAKTAGATYALGMLTVGATPPSLATSPTYGVFYNFPLTPPFGPFFGGTVAGLAALPGTVLNGSIADSGFAVAAAVTP